MKAVLTALADPARWRLVSLLAERPRPVGVLAQLAGARQPQTTKHLQTLERAGIVSSQRSGQRRIYSLRRAPLRELAAVLNGLADTADQPGGARETFDRYGLSVAGRAAGGRGRRLGGRTRRSASSGRSPRRPEVVWRHLTEPALLADWWTPDDLRVSELVFEARPGGRIVLEYRDVEDTDGSDVVVGRAEGVVDDVRPGERLAYRSSPTLPDGDRRVHVPRRHRAPTPPTRARELDIDFRITDSTVESAEFIAGIEIGFGQSLDKLAASIAADRETRQRTETRSTK